MKLDFRTLANSSVRNLTPYQPGKPIEELERELGITAAIKLASNENPLGPSPHAIHAVKDILQHAHFYPDGGCYDLKQTLATHLDLSPEQITVGNGSENILELLVKAYLHKGDTAVISQYAFLTIPILLESYGVKAKVVPAKNWCHDIEGMIKAIDDRTRVVFLVNPNNPTGTYINETDFHFLMENVPPYILVVVDEAYAEYIIQGDYPNTRAHLNRYPNLVITRTFSKVYGLAALRLGYGISSIEIADILNRARLPFNVNTIAAKAALAALKDDEHVKKSISVNQDGMVFLMENLTKLRCEFIPSLGNFIAINVQNGREMYEKLLRTGVIVRPLAAYNMPAHIRVTIGTTMQNERFIAALQKIID